MEWFADCTLKAVDVETTGLDIDTDRPVEVAFVSGTGSGTHVHDLPGWPRVVSCGMSSAPGALALHGITDAEAAAGWPMMSAMAAACTEVVRAVEAGEVLVGANIWFDLTMIHRAARAAGVPSFADRVAAADMHIIDPLVWDRGWRPQAEGGRSLGALARFYGVESSGAHRAAPDARTALGVVRAMASAALGAPAGVGPVFADTDRWALVVGALSAGPGTLTELLHGWWVQQQVDRVRRARAQGGAVVASAAGWPFEP